MKPTRVVIVYNEPVLPADHPDAASERENLVTVETVRSHLAQAGFRTEILEVGTDPGKLVAGICKSRPEVVFNLFEGLANQGATEAYAAGLLEWMGVPFTGCPSQTLSLARSKPLTKHLLHGAGLPTPGFLVVENLPVPACPLPWPVIVKPAGHDASVGLDQQSVVERQDQLNDRVSLILQRYGSPVLVEQFIQGRELNVGLIEAPDLRTLPISEIRFLFDRPGEWPIVTYDAKWKPGSRDFEATPPRYPAQVDEILTGRINDLARKAFLLLGCRDYTRVDFRVDSQGNPFILEVNPNPDFSLGAGLAGGLHAAGLTHAQFTIQLVRQALERARR